MSDKFFNAENDTSKNNNQPEVWKAIPGYEGIYEVSNQGTVRSVDRIIDGRWGPTRRKSHVLSTNNVHDGYLQVKFSVAGKKSQPLVHRLVADTFIPNPDGLPQVNHKDGNPSNNNVENLEWCSVSENAIHRDRVLGRKTGRPLKGVFCLETETEYASSHHASRALGIGQGNIFAVCQGKYKTAGGYHFKFVEEMMQHGR